MRITKLILLTFSVIALTAFGSGCRTAAEQGTVAVEVTAGKIVKVHEPGDLFTTLGPNTTAYEVDLRDHMDGVDFEGATQDNAPFYMKVDVVYHPIHTPGSVDGDPLAKHLSAFGFEDDERATRRWKVLNQLVRNATRNATSGKYDAYALRANQGKVLQDIQTELIERFENELYCKLVSVGMEVQPQFKSDTIDTAANMVVAAKKQKDAEQAWKEAAQIKLEKQQIENQIYANPAALQLELLNRQLQIVQAQSEGIARHQGTLILGTLPNGGMQLQLPTGGK